MIVAGEKLVEEIQVMVPLGNALEKGRIGYDEFKQRIKENHKFHGDVSMNKSMSMSKGDATVKSMRSRAALSRFGRSKVMSRVRLTHLRQNSQAESIHDNSHCKVMNRSNMVSILKHHDVSRP